MISTVEARNAFSDLINRASYGKERIILTRRGRPVAAVVPIDDIETLERLEDAADAAEADRIVREGGRTYSLGEVKARLGLE